MTDDLDRESTLRGYILGHASEAERVGVEERIFASDEMFEQMEAIEAELVDEYIANELSDADRAGFERRLSWSKPLSEKLLVARQLRAVAPRSRSAALPPRPRRSTSGWMPVAAGLGIAATITLVLIRGSLRTESPPQEPPVAARPSEPAAAPAPTATPTPEGPATAAPPTPGPAVVATAVLGASLVRSGTSPAVDVRVPAADGAVRFTLLVEAGDEHPSYLAELSTSDGVVVWHSVVGGQRSPDGHVVLADVPAERLPGGRYQFVLSAPAAGRANELAVYPFRVVR